jgi:hypothetical protein
MHGGGLCACVDASGVHAGARQGAALSWLAAPAAGLGIHHDKTRTLRGRGRIVSAYLEGCG